ncbi:SycD/LcrH family type III secretion system chaperone [Endozoicomonas sp. Mp262]|uniref:SycD/LcrH family type III secretion system chaperone n=1 Tax=Endozoicomonas sp. Mp262 TaxID=2919499 RepID=UPI0021DA4482
MNTAVSEQSNPEEISEALIEFFGSGGTVKTLKDIPPGAIEGGYATALNFYENGRLKDSEKIFQLLCLLDHYDPRFFMGLGACRQQMEQYEQAIESYSFVTVLDCNDPRPPFHSAECHMALGKLEEAKSGFYAASHFEGGGERFKELRERARAMYALVSKKMDTVAKADDR